MRRILILMLLGAGLSMSALAEVPKAVDGKLVDEDGMTLYMFDKDVKPGKSMCMGGCAGKWPAALADDYDKASGEWSFVKRDNGKRQWAYKGHPLYRWGMDKKPGDAMGDGMGGMWHVAKP